MSYNPKEFDVDVVSYVYSPHMKNFAERTTDHVREKLGETQRQNLEAYCIQIKNFGNKEQKPKIETNVRDRKVYVFHNFTDDSGAYDPNYGYMKLFMIGDAMRRADILGITYILPHMPYQRQDRKDEARVPITAKLALDLIEASTAPTSYRIVTFDMHADQIEGFSNRPIMNLYASPLFAEYIRQSFDGGDKVVVSPDAGGVKRARALAKKLDCEIAICDKRRPGANQAEILNIVGNVNGRKAIIIDDMVDTAGTLIKAAEALRQNGAIDIYLCATHPILSPKLDDPAWVPEQKIPEYGIKLITTDTIPREPSYYRKNENWLTVLSVTPMIATALHELETRGSISKLFDDNNKENVINFAEMLTVL